MNVEQEYFEFILLIVSIAFLTFKRLTKAQKRSYQLKDMQFSIFMSCTQALYITFEFWLAFSLPGLAGAIIMAPTSSKFEYYMQEIITNLSLELKAGFFWLF